MTKHTKNEDYFGQKSLQSIYWAGFIAARGGIYANSSRVKLQVKECKEERLYRFFEHVEIEGKKVSTYKSKEGYIQKSASINSLQWKEDLEVIYNLPSHRTEVYIPNLTKDIEVQCYLLGYLDTGAYVGYTNINNSNSAFRIQMYGGINFLNWIKSYVDKWVHSSWVEAASFTRYNSKSFTYSITSQRAVDLYNILSNLPIDKSDTWGWKLNSIIKNEYANNNP